MADRKKGGEVSSMVEFLLGLSVTFNVAFIFMWIAGDRINKAQQKELQDQFEQDFGRQLTKYFENWMYKA